MAYGGNKKNTGNVSKGMFGGNKSPKLKFGGTTISKKNNILEKRARKAKAKAQPPRPIEDEENRIPEKYQGDITFTRTIYSKGDFNRKVETGFSELSSEILPIEIDQFFNYYNEIFFDIPKEGENSHTTIIETSLDYVESYNNPLQGVVDNLNNQITELEGEIRRLENELQNLVLGDSDSLTGALAEQQAVAEQQAAQAEYDAYIAQIGDINNPTLKYDDLKSRLGTISNKENRRTDLRQAYEKAKASNLKYSNRTRDQWKADVRKSSGGNRQDDIFKAIDNQVKIIQDKANSLKP